MLDERKMMTKEELVKAIQNPEWTDIEFKQCKNGVSKDVYQTVSAFANTYGGYIVFGVKANKDRYGHEVVGIDDVDKVQNEFLSCLRSGDKLSRIINAEAEIYEVEGKRVLVFYIPEVEVKEKPIHLNKRIDKAYIRRGGGDELCTESELRVFIRDASYQTYDGSLMYGLDPNKCMDTTTLKWYRAELDKRQGSKYVSLTDIEYLIESGLVVEENDKLIPTKASILLFGKTKYVLQILPRPVVDYQRIDYMEDNWDAEKRWHDRLVIDTNLLEAWKLLLDKYSLIADVPFSLDETTLQRRDVPLEYRTFREAVVNLLIHQDYGDANRKPVIKMFKDKTVFWNPGAANYNVDELLENRYHPIRNPLIVRAFRQIGLCEEAGTGIRTIMDDCRKLGLFPAQIENDKTEFSFSITILKRKILSSQLSHTIDMLGLKLTETEAAIFSYLLLYPRLSLPIAKVITGKSEADTLEMLRNLIEDTVVRYNQINQSWVLSNTVIDRIKNSDDSLKTGQGSDQVTKESDQVTKESDQVTKESDQVIKKHKGEYILKLASNREYRLSGVQYDIMSNSNTPVSMNKLMDVLSMSSRNNLRKRHLVPLIEQGIINMTNPELVTHRNQKYCLSDLGKKIYEQARKESIERD